MVSKLGPQEAIIGIGVIWEDHRGRKALTSSFDYISKLAFEDIGIRKDSRNQPFQYFLPLAIKPAHFDKALPCIETSLKTLSTTLGRARPNQGPTKRHEALGALFAMANQLIVDLMNTCSRVRIGTGSQEKAFLHASERALTGYCSLIHLLVSLAIKDSRVAGDARRAVNAFRQSQRCPQQVGHA